MSGSSDSSRRASPCRVICVDKPLTGDKMRKSPIGRVVVIDTGYESYEHELANRDELLAHPHVVATGHYAWYSSVASKELQRRAGENMAALLDGEIPEDCLNPEVF